MEQFNKGKKQRKEDNQAFTQVNPKCNSKRPFENLSSLWGLMISISETQIWHFSFTCSNVQLTNLESY